MSETFSVASGGAASTGLAVVRSWNTFVPDGYVPVRPPLQPMNDVAVFPVHVTVPDEPKEIVCGDQVNVDVSTTGIVVLGRVTLLLKVVSGGPVSVQDVVATVASSRRPSAVVLPLSRP
jgi:hypothetical protein